MENATPDGLVLLLHRFGLERDRLRLALARATGLALADLDALEHLEADGPLTQRELGERLQLSSGGVTVLVDRLEGAGLVERRRHPTDRRAVLVGLNPAAAAGAPPALADYHDALGAAARAVPSEGRASATGLLAAATREARRATERLRRAPPPAS